VKTPETKENLANYEEFLNTEEIEVPRELMQSVLTQIHSLLHPSAWLVFGKLLGIHLVIGFLSLSICHQFDMNPFGTEHSLSDWFMSTWGNSACMISCGVFFVSFSILTAGYFLSAEEFRVMRRTEIIQILALGSLSLIVFYFLGTALALAIAALWLTGALFGGLITTEAMWALRRQINT
jgi:hypothetical protein